MIPVRFLRSRLLRAAFLLPLPFLSACDEELPEAPRLSQQVVVRYPTTFRTQIASGTTVRFVNRDNGQQFERITDGAGTVTFDGLPAGTYDISASRSLTAAEAQDLTQIQGAQPQQLAAARNGLVLSQQPGSFLELRLAGSALSQLVFKEVFYNGSANNPAPGITFANQFFEIFNNSDQVVFLDSLCIGNVAGPAGQINPTTVVYPYTSDQANVYLTQVYMIPGTGQQYPLQPGQSIVIAQDGINHRAINTGYLLDLSTADWETFNERPSAPFDVDGPTVPNMVRLYQNSTIDFFPSVFGGSLVIFRIPSAVQRFTIGNPLALTSQPETPGNTNLVWQLPASNVLDAFEGLRDATSGSFKRIPVGLDAGFVFVRSGLRPDGTESTTYVSKSFRRRTARQEGGRRYLQDTNNSTADFEEITPPTPRGF